MCSCLANTRLFGQSQQRGARQTPVFLQRRHERGWTVCSHSQPRRPGPPQEQGPLCLPRARLSERGGQLQPRHGHVNGHGYRVGGEELKPTVLQNAGQEKAGCGEKLKQRRNSELVQERMSGVPDREFTTRKGGWCKANLRYTTND